MNVHDSERVIGTLEQQGYARVETEVAADLILYNTCSIRDKAEQKVFNRLDDHKKLYKQGKRFGVLGGVAQQEGEKAFERAPYVSPGAGDGLTVVSAMRHANPKAVTMLLSAFPEMDAAAQAILLQADQILVKPMDITALVDAIGQRLASGSAGVRVVETVAAILERSAQTTIRDWFELVQTNKIVMAVPLSYEQRCGHLP